MASPRMAAIAQEYDALLEGFAIGDRGQVALAVGESRAQVRAQLAAAASRRGLTLRFRPGRGPLTFQVEAAPPGDVTSSPTPVQTPAVPLPAPPVPAAPQAVAPPAARAQAAARSRPPRVEQSQSRSSQAPSRSRGKRRSGPSRYDDVLPRWMRGAEKKRPKR